MLTLKHFLDRPTWAAAAGYDFNIIDCMSCAAARYGDIWSTLRDHILDFPDIEVREVPLSMLIMLAGLFGIVVYPFIFWIFGIFYYIRCRKHRAKYFGQPQPEIVQINLRNWLKKCEKKFNKGGRHAKTSE
ncbi:hypothetical protein [Yersinia frederiksenii]|uniref:Uncharacterized protein n=1 Tax=Yersinia frederiksenii TaxID=29484 RepID=A0AAI9ENZ0_YERFR|nr:hypothetical protein [Yersinia frederiksenii]CFQ96826.1 Uncharacterised protein [Yersinia frederiksenii]HEI6963655.1 hypothetical protein [Yersinia enterocolitica]